MRLDTSVKDLSGIGKTRAEKLAKMGIFTLRDLVYHYPRAYENRGDVRLLGDYELNSPKSYVLTVASEVSNVRLKNRMTMSKFKAFDESGSVDIVFFNSAFVKDVFHVGAQFRFYGKPTFSKVKRLNLVNPKYEPILPGRELRDFIPVYPAGDGISSKLLDKLIHDSLEEVISEITDYLSEEIRLANDLPTLRYALYNIHFPESEDAFKRAMRRLAFDEMLLFALGISMLGAKRKRASGVPFTPSSIKPFTDLLPYELTDSQKAAINDIYRDTVLSSKDQNATAMSRIVVGDVGCGKTVCAAAAIYFSHCSGYQSAMMVPTEILAQQHYQDLGDLLGRLGIKTALLTGSTGAKARREIYSGISNGEIDVVIGTHALLTDKVSFARLGLIVTDEQHRFGVAQRAVLKDKQKNAHMLVMSATPIPRSLALALYGDLDISRITDMPKGRMRVDTYVVNESYRKRLNAFIEKQVALGGQCYIICPSIDSGEDEDSLLIAQTTDGLSLVDTNTLNLKNTVEYTEELRRALPNLKIACLHGRMKNAEKEEIMAEFAGGRLDVLVSTTVIEVGVNVPNASLMVIENAERFGLSQLHQLRGRVGRGSRKSYCILVSDLNTDKARARLDVLKTTYDGFEIASRDLALRGPGDFFSSSSYENIRQSGGFEFKLASMCDDSTLFDAAFSAAKKILQDDPELTSADNAHLAAELSSAISSSSTIS